MFRANVMKNSVIWLIFHTYIFGQTCLAPTVESTATHIACTHFHFTVWNLTAKQLYDVLQNLVQFTC